MATETSKPEPWRFCTICDLESERPFSVERAYIKHLSSQRHLRRTNQPLKDFRCTICSKQFSRESEVQRHLINGRCSGPPGSRLTTESTTTSSMKHALSISPNGVPWKIHRTAASTIDATVGSPPLPASRFTVGHHPAPVVHAYNGTESQVSADRPLQRLVEDALPSRRTVVQIERADSLMTRLLVTHRQPGTEPSLALPSAITHEIVTSNTQTSHALMDENHSKGPGIYDASGSARDRSTPAPGEIKPANQSSASINSDEQVDHWLSDAMKSASLKEDDLAHVTPRSVISSTPAGSLGSLGSLFLLRSPKVLTPMFSFPSLHFSTKVIRPFARSAEMPGPMLAELVDDELLMTEALHKQAIVARPNPIMEATMWTCKQSYDALDNRGEVSLRYAINGKSLLHCASTGDALGAYTILMKEAQVDINHCSVSDHIAFSNMQHLGTSLMVAARGGHYHVMYALLKASALKREQRLDLSICDQHGHTAIHLALQRERGRLGRFQPLEDADWPVRCFLRTVVEILCCDCPEESLTSDGYLSIYYSRDHTEGYQAVEIRPSLGSGHCKWCRKLQQPDWPDLNDVQVINDCIQERTAPITDAKYAFLVTRDWVSLDDE
jgi:hypothetical protein